MERRVPGRAGHPRAPAGTVKATVLIETVLAAFEMDEILWELRSTAGLNAGRWDYIFSVIKKFRNLDGFVLPDQAQVTMTVPFMRAYTELLVKTCHCRGAHAIGGMAAFVPNRRDPEVTEQAIAKVREDKRREAGDGCDGTWVAHPDLVPVAQEVFDAVLGDRPNQLDRQRPDVVADPAALVELRGARWDGDRRRAPDQRGRRHPLPRLLAERHRGGGDLQPHGGRRHRRDQPPPGLAVVRAGGHPGRRSDHRRTGHGSDLRGDYVLRLELGPDGG